MNILPISTINSNTNFQGKVITKGHWPKNIDTFFKSMPELIETAENSNYNIIGNMHRKFIREYPSSPKIARYKLTISAEKENPSLLDNIKVFLGLNPKIELSEHHHREDRYPYIMEDRIVRNTLAQKLKLDK